VRGVVSDKDAQRGRATGPQKSIIDALIQEEILKFTSLDALGGSSQPLGPLGQLGAQSLSPEPVSNGQSPLDPGSFIDTRGWADDLESRPPAFLDDEVGQPAKRSQPLPSVGKYRPDARRETKAPEPPPPDPLVDSLEDMPEPERERPSAPAPPTDADDTRRTVTPNAPAQPRKAGQRAPLFANVPGLRDLKPRTLLVVAVVVIVGIVGGGLAIFASQRI